MSGDDSGEYPTLWEERIVLSRKEHVCTACWQGIPPKCHYTLIKCLDDGKWSTLKRCPACERMYQHLVDRCRIADDEYEARIESGEKHWEVPNPPEYPYPMLDCGHSYKDTWGEEPPGEIAALAFMSPLEADILSSSRGRT